MTERPILKLPNPTTGRRQSKGGGFKPKTPSRKPSGERQSRRLTDIFDPLVTAFEGDNPTIELRADPAGIAPERALVFETATPIADFARVAREAGLEVFAEETADRAAELEEDDFAPPEGDDHLFPTLYATMPRERTLERMLSLWRRYQRGQKPPSGLTPWWRTFEMLIDLRPWGPEDRFPEGARAIIEERLPFSEDEPVLLEVEIWPSKDKTKRGAWRDEIKQALAELGGRVIHESLIEDRDFVYDALLIELSAGDVRAMIDDPYLAGGLASVDGIQFILPQLVAQSSPILPDTGAGEVIVEDEFDPEAPLRAVLLDGIPVAAHAALDGGVVIEDVHDLAPLSIVEHRRHGTAMASLILRGDLEADGTPVADSRLACIPILVDSERHAHSPSNKLFLDVIHTALVRCFLGEDPLTPDAFLVNLSIGIPEQRFAGRISALARLLDWWSWKHGVLFTVAAGNVPEDLDIRGLSSTTFANASAEERQTHLRKASIDQAYGRSLFAPSEAINALTVGALSRDLSPKTMAGIPDLIRYETSDEDQLPHLSSAVGLGPGKALKPDLLVPGGAQEWRILPGGTDTRLRLSDTQRTGLVVAEPSAAAPPTTRCRGTSGATALATRSLLQCARALTEDEGPYQGLELPRRELALATRALAVNAAHWPDGHAAHEADAIAHLKKTKSSTVTKNEVARHFGYGVLEPVRMVDGPNQGATLIGLGRIRKDQSRIFELFLPPSLSGEKLPRHLRVTMAWFSPVTIARSSYRGAALEAACVDDEGKAELKDWRISLQGTGPDVNMAGRGSVWSRRLTRKNMTTPTYDEGTAIRIRVQCREIGANGLSPDEDIAFAIAASFEIEGTIKFDVREEIRAQIQVKSTV